MYGVIYTYEVNCLNISQDSVLITEGFSFIKG